jgi:hypothetical protein
VVRVADERVMVNNALAFTGYHGLQRDGIEAGVGRQYFKRKNHRPLG